MIFEFLFNRKSLFINQIISRSSSKRALVYPGLHVLPRYNAMISPFFYERALDQLLVKAPS